LLKNISPIILQKDPLSQEDIDAILEILWRTKFVGDFPLGIVALLVSVPIALEEVNSYRDEPLTRAIFLKLLKEQGIHVFSTIDDWQKFKNPPKVKKRLEGVLVS
jgi:hypothetical protein